MTFTEIEIYCKGYEIREARRKELPRLIATRLLNMFRSEGSAPINLKDVMPLYTDRNEQELMTEDEFEGMKEWRKQIKWQIKN